MVVDSFEGDENRMPLGPLGGRLGKHGKLRAGLESKHLECQMQQSWKPHRTLVAHRQAEVKPKD